MPLINCKVELSLKWYETCLQTAATTATFEITDTKLYVPIVTLTVEDDSKLSKLLNEGFKRRIYWNEYKVTPNKIVLRELFDSSCQSANRLFVLAYDNTARNNRVSVDSYKKYFLPRVKIKITISKLMVETFMINQLMIELNNMMSSSNKYKSNNLLCT